MSSVTWTARPDVLSFPSSSRSHAADSRNNRRPWAAVDALVVPNAERLRSTRLLAFCLATVKVARVPGLRSKEGMRSCPISTASLGNACWTRAPPQRDRP